MQEAASDLFGSSLKHRFVCAFPCPGALLCHVAFSPLPKLEEEEQK
jgi:hypothetical protein